MHTPFGQRVFVRGRALELWEDPARPFGWSVAELTAYAECEQWELLFNALTLIAAREHRE